MSISGKKLNVHVKPRNYNLYFQVCEVVDLLISHTSVFVKSVSKFHKWFNIYNLIFCKSELNNSMANLTSGFGSNGL